MSGDVEPLFYRRLRMEITFDSTFRIMRQHLYKYGCIGHRFGDDFLLWRIDKEFDECRLEWNKPFQEGDILAYRGLSRDTSDFWFRIVPAKHEEEGPKIVTTPESFLWFIKEIDLEDKVADDLNCDLADLCEFKEVKSQAYAELAATLFESLSSVSERMRDLDYNCRNLRQIINTTNE
jgi:hypothetical protein